MAIPVKCPHCEVTSASGQGHGSHMRKYHPEFYTPKNPGTYDAQKAKMYRERVTTKSHIAIHCCPNCGLNLDVVAAALEIAQKGVVNA